MIKIYRFGYKDARTAITFRSDAIKDNIALTQLFQSFVADNLGIEVDFVSYADKIPLNVEVTAVFEGNTGKFGWTWKEKKHEHKAD